MTPAEPERPAHHLSDHDLIERLERVRWLLADPTRVQITAALLQAEIAGAPNPPVPDLAIQLDKPRETLVEELRAMRHQGALAGDFWLSETSLDKGTVGLVAALSEPLLAIARAIGPPPAQIPSAPPRHTDRWTVPAAAQMAMAGTFDYLQARRELEEAAVADGAAAEPPPLPGDSVWDDDNLWLDAARFN